MSSRKVMSAKPWLNLNLETWIHTPNCTDFHSRAPHSDEILMLKMEVFRKFFFIKFSRSNVIKNNIMVTSEAMLVQAETLLLQKLSFPNETLKLHPDNCHAS